MEEENAALRIAKIISKLRIEKNISQCDLADMLSVSPVQVCRLEGGQHLPHEKTLIKLENALKIPGQLVAIRQEQIRRNRQARGRAPARSPLVPIRNFIYYDDQEARQTFDPSELMKEFVLPEIEKYKLLEDHLGLTHCTDTAFLKTFGLDAVDALNVASATRLSLGAGTAPLAELIPLLESKNVRILFTDRMPDRLKSASFYDTACQTLIVCLDTKATPEAQLYGIAKELGYASIFLSDNGKKVRQKTDRTPQFVRAFASALLMPDVAIAALVDQLRITNEEWTLELICQLKWRFGVSTEVFARRLEEIGKISSSLLDQIISEINTHYSDHPEDPEPGGSTSRPLPQNTWLSVLTARASMSQRQQIA